MLFDTSGYKCITAKHFDCSSSISGDGDGDGDDSWSTVIN